ncbi:Transketolase central region [Lancefieldella parvula DSM 20469]|uniref:Transketolase central region n=1 Tax=Lancefieldella parvula (strain ATCC 33793 / DSM 20469 / CCUG 32760 / JCM 10300 / KCTC 3663 / VPI 0546 / 1246) TaxID=521095 RepID=C8W8X8_LANP1|nr:transketolase C-terminal domain-containing protein [Lancefieldella parvula]ACV50566.1 Transketolase central region [Lancefieldella parvula DSM 20469]
MLDTSSKPACISAEESQMLADMNTKEVFGWVMGKLAEDDELLTVAVADYGRRLNLDRFRELRPEGYIQCGIAEQNLIEVASACANEGFHVFAPCYATFVTSRTLDQIRINLGMMKSPVMLVGVAAGCESATTGPSHMALEDIAVTRTIPGLSVFNPCDNAQLAATLMELAKNPRPAYVRMTSCDGVNLHPNGYVFDASGVEKLFESPRVEGASGVAGASELEDAVQLRRVSVLATGAITSRVVEAAQRVADQITTARTNIKVYGVSSIKPLDTSLTQICQYSDVVITVEEHSILGGFGSAVVEQISASGTCPQVIRVGMPDKYLEADVHHNILARAGLSVESLQEVFIANC